MASIRFSVNPMKNGTMIIRAVLSDGNEKPLPKNTGYVIPSNKIKGEYKHWDKKDYRVKALDNAIEINALISRWTSEFDTYKTFCKTNNRKVDIAKFRESLIAYGEVKENTIDLTGKDVQDVPPFMTIAWEWYNQQKGDPAKGIPALSSPGTYKQYKTFNKQVEKYEKERGIILQLKDINKAFYKDFGLWLIISEKNINSTINRKLTRFGTIMDTVFPHIISTQFYKDVHRFKEKDEDVARWAMWPDEQDKFAKVKTNNENELLIKDMFIFAQRTTLRLSDLLQLWPHHRLDIPIKTGKASILDLTQIKTTNYNTVPLDDIALEIWSRRAIDPMQKIFMVPTNLDVNEILRKLFVRAKINRVIEKVRVQGNDVIRESKPFYEVVSFHMSRNTAITEQLTKLPPSIVKQNAGIKKMDTLMRYNRDNQTVRAELTLEAMNKPKKKGKDDK